MDIAAREARRGVSEGVVIIAERQTAGRGRQGRPWLSLPGNLFLTVILRPSAEQVPQLIMLGSIGVVRTLESLGLRPGIKWPNDVLVGERKISGILIETTFKGAQPDYALLGIGINVKLDPKQFDQLAFVATSLSALGIDIHVFRLAWMLLENLDRLYQELKSGYSLLPIWRRYLIVLGKRVHISGGMDINGIAEDVTPEGNLLLRCDDGRLVQIPVGDVSLRTN